MKPCAESCERNQQPILEILRDEFAESTHVLEIGSGTGQHAAYLAPRLPQLRWQPSDLEENHETISQWLQTARGCDIPEPLDLDVTSQPWPDIDTDAVFSANTAHIMPWQAVRAMFAGIGQLLPAGGRFCLYGPFNEHGRYSSDSNAEFDGWLKLRDRAMGIRDIDDLEREAQISDMRLVRRHAMPANNQILVFVKLEPSG